MLADIHNYVCIYVQVFEKCQIYFVESISFRKNRLTFVPVGRRPVYPIA